MRIFFSAGEASGDAYGAELLTRLRRTGIQIQAQALGGRRLREAGAEIIADSSTWGVIGIAEAVRVFFKAKRGFSKAKASLSIGAPGVFVPIDYGYLNIALAEFAKQKGWKVVYFSPPGAWRKDRQGEDLPRVTDAIITPFSWSAEILNRMGANGHWFGHPIKQMIRENAESLAADVSRTAVAILPGSRQSEIDLLLPLFAKTLEGFGGQAEIAVASSLDLECVKTRWRQLAPGRDDLLTQGDTYGVLRRARAAIVCSGTATLEAALCGCPHIVAYRVSKLVELQARLARFKVPHIAQPNILLGREVVPEFIQERATPTALAEALRRLLEDESARQKQLDAFQEIDRLLGPDDALDKSVEFIAAYLRA